MCWIWSVFNFMNFNFSILPAVLFGKTGSFHMEHSWQIWAIGAEFVSYSAVMVLTWVLCFLTANALTQSILCPICLKWKPPLMLTWLTVPTQTNQNPLYSLLTVTLPQFREKQLLYKIQRTGMPLWCGMSFSTCVAFIV